MAAAYRAGREAARNRKPRRNPYDGNAEKASERVLSIMWARGYTAGNPIRLDEDDSAAPVSLG
jgi:hypothetical protein